jgi:asparagine N-glycosylation enzyme membrane subunit Stt3
MSTKRVLIVCGFVLVLTIVLEMIFAHPHVLYWWHGLIGFDFVFGLLGTLLLLGLAQGLVKQLVQRKEDYYDNDGGGDSHA